MAKKLINIGTSANKGNGDPLRTAFDKVNDNFNELYAGNFVSPTSLESSLISAQDGVHNLGSGTKQWNNLHVKDFIHLGGKKISMSAGGALLVNNGIVQVTDLVGSVFADDSKLMMDGLTGILYGPMIGDVTGSVFADDSTIMVDAVGKLFVGNLVGDVTGTVSSIANHTTANLTENTNLYYTDARANSAIDARVTGAYISTLSGVIADSVDGDLTGSVFGDDSTLLVDGVNNKVMLTTNTTTELAEGTNLYYTDARADARIVNAGSANWNAAFAWGNHASAGYQVAGAPHDGDIEGSVFGDDSTLLVDAVNNIIPSSVVSGTEATNWNTAYSWGDHSVAGYLTSVPAQTFASLTGKPTTVAGYGITDAHTGTFDGEVTGSVFGDDSTLLVDGNNNKIVGPVLSSDLRSTTSNVRIGLDAGLTNQGTYSIAIGERAGNLNQSADGIAIGYAAGRDDQQTDGIAIGQNAGQVNQGASSVAIGTMVGKTNQHANTIMLSATGATFNSTQANALFVKPIRSATMTTILGYDATSGEVTHNAAIPGYINIADLKTLVAASADFADYQTRIAAL